MQNLSFIESNEFMEIFIPFSIKISRRISINWIGGLNYCNTYLSLTFNLMKLKIDLINLRWKSILFPFHKYIDWNDSTLKITSNKIINLLPLKENMSDFFCHHQWEITTKIILIAMFSWNLNWPFPLWLIFTIPPIVSFPIIWPVFLVFQTLCFKRLFYVTCYVIFQQKQKISFVFTWKFRRRRHVLQFFSFLKLWDHQ